MSTTRDAVAKQLLGDFLVILLFGALAFAIYAFGLHLADKTRALGAEGRPVQVEVTRVLKGLPRKVDVAYVIDGKRYTDETFAWDPAPSVGSRLTALYHPDDPSRVRIRGLDEASLEEDRQPFVRLPLLFLAPLLILVVARVARLSGRDPLTVVGPVVGALLLFLVIGVNFDDGVQRQITARLGPTAAGLPSPIAVSLVQLLTLGPLLIGWGKATLALMGVAMARGEGAGRLGFVLWALRSDEARRHPGARRLFLVTSSLLLTVMLLSIVVLSATA